MDADRVKGSFKQFSGGIKETVGKVLGDKKTETEGKAEKTEGEIQNTVGGVKDAVREVTEKS
ncbi:MAG: CsbD family protein [Defluviicoccus sp.]|nr:CsbD family protein [Defluviicoccus sp.]